MVLISSHFISRRNTTQHLSMLRANMIQDQVKSTVDCRDASHRNISYFPSLLAQTLSLSETECLESDSENTFPMMKPSSKQGLYSTSTTVTYTYTYHNDHPTPPQHTNSTQLPPQSQSNAALTIQSAYRSHRIRTLYRKIAAVDSEADQLQRLIQRQDTVDAVRTNHLEKLRMNEALMALLLKLDSVPGIDPTVREARRKVTRRIVGLQEILDSVSETKVDECNWWSTNMNWDEFIADMEESVCRERGGDEMERFCAQNLGFRCLQRFLSEP